MRVAGMAARTAFGMVLAGLAACAGPPASDVTLAEQCRAQGGRYGLPPAEPLRAGRYVATLPQMPGCLLEGNGPTVFRIDVAPGQATPHFANLAMGPMAQPGGAFVAGLPDLRRLAEEDAQDAVSRGGTGLRRGLVIRAGQAAGQRLIQTEIGPDQPATACLPVRLESEQEGFVAFPPGTLVVFGGEERYCAADADDLAEFSFIEMTRRGDPDAAARGAAAREAARQFMASIRLAGTAARRDETPQAAQCRIVHGGTWRAGPQPPFRRADFTVAVPGAGWCLSPIPRGDAVFHQDLPENVEPARFPPATPAERRYARQLSVLRLTPDEWGGGRRELRDLGELRRLLEGIVRSVRAGSTTYAPPAGRGRAALRWIELGPDMAEAGCIPMRMEHGSADPALVPPGSTLIFRSEYRYCLGPGGVTAILVAQDRGLDTDARGTERAAQTRALAQPFFASLRWGE